MEELMDLIIADESPSAVSDNIKDVLFNKSAGKIDALKPVVADAMFGSEEEVPDIESEAGEIDNEVETEEEE